MYVEEWMTVAADQRCCLQIWVVTEVVAEIAAEVLAEVAGGEHVSVVDACWRYRRVLAWFSTWQICKVADGVRIVQGSCRNVATDFVEVESTGCRTLKVGRIFSFVESCRFTVKK
jgi:hypothetical protein